MIQAHKRKFEYRKWKEKEKNSHMNWIQLSVTLTSPPSLLDFLFHCFLILDFTFVFSFLSCVWHCYVADNGIPHSFQLICHEAYYTQSMCFNLKFMFLPVQKTTFNSHSGNLALLNVQREGAAESRTSSLVLTVCSQRFDSNSELTALQAKERPYLVLQDLDTERVQNFF